MAHVATEIGETMGRIAARRNTGPPVRSQAAVWIMAAPCALLFAVGAAQAACADVALVLAVDASGSISATEFEQQKTGYLHALTQPKVLHAFRDAGVVDLAAVIWGDSTYPAQIIPWHRITARADIGQFTALLAATPRRVAGNTNIGVGIEAAIKLFEQDGRCALRRVIDVSGDGRENQMSGRERGLALSPAREHAMELGITINGLAITAEDPGLGDYYRDFVAGGPGSFVLEVDGMHSFPAALGRKLRRELLSLDEAACPQAGQAHLSSCHAG